MKRERKKKVKDKKKCQTNKIDKNETHKEGETEIETFRIPVEFETSLFIIRFSSFITTFPFFIIILYSLPTAFSLHLCFSIIYFFLSIFFYPFFLFFYGST